MLKPSTVWSALCVSALIATIPASAQKTYSLSDAKAAEGDWAELTVSLSEAGPSGGLTFTTKIDYSGSASSADVGTVVPIEPADLEGVTETPLFITLRADLEAEQDETFVVTIETDAPGWSAKSASATVTIQNVPGIPVPSEFPQFLPQAHPQTGQIIALAVFWRSVEGASSYDFAYKEATLNDWTQSSIAGDLPYFQLSEPKTGSTYEFRIRTVVGEKRSPWSAVARYKIPALGDVTPTPDLLVVPHSTIDAAIHVIWIPVSNATHYNIRWGPGDSLNALVENVKGVKLPSGSLTHALTHLNVGVQYGVQIQAVAPITGVSPWSPVDFSEPSTTGGGGDGGGDGDDGDDDGDDDDDGIVGEDPADDQRPGFGDARVPNQIWSVGVPVRLVLPEASGGDGSLTYSLEPDLPAGLRFDARARSVAGVPATAAAATRYTYTATDSDSRGADSAKLRFSVSVRESDPEIAACSPTTVPLVFGDYEVRMCYETPEGEVGDGRSGIWASNESGLLWFFDRGNAEVLIKVLDGCGINGHYWVFVAPVTDLGFNLYVSDSTGRHWSHHNRKGETAEPKSDTSAFPCGRGEGKQAAADPAQDHGEAGAAIAAALPAAGGHTNCVAETAPLVFGDYKVSMCYETPEGVIGEARSGIWASGQAGLLWFFDRGNAEVLIKVLDGCEVNGHYWVFVAPVTNLAFNLNVTNGQGHRWIQRNAQGMTAQTRGDTAAFPCTEEERTP